MMASYILLSTVTFLSLCLKPVFSDFEVAQVNSLSVEDSRIHSIKTITSGSLLKCMQECKSLGPSTYPSCSVVGYNDASKSCELSYVHKSSRPQEWDPKAWNASAATKHVFPVHGSELPGAHYCSF